MSEPASRPFFRADAATPVHEVFGGSIQILVPASATAGAYGVICSVWSPGAGPRLHVHRREDELLHVLEGSLAYWCGGKVFRGGPGSTIHLPRDVPHAFVNTGTVPARQLGIFTPGGFEQMFAEAARRAHVADDQNALDDLPSARYGLEVLGPNPLI